MKHVKTLNSSKPKRMVDFQLADYEDCRPN